MSVALHFYHMFETMYRMSVYLVWSLSTWWSLGTTHKISSNTSIEFRNRVFSLRMYFHTTTTNNRLWYFAVIGNNDILILAFCGIYLTMQTLLSHNVVQLKKLSKALRDNLKTKSNINNNNKLNIIPGDNSEFDEKL